MAASSSSQSNATKEYIVRVPKSNRKKYHMMRFNNSLGNDFFKNWTNCKIERENNFKEFKEEDMPRFGAGSEYGRDLKEEARRKRLGINKKRYKADDQPWLLSVGAKGNKKKYKGIREGGVSDHVAWYVFMQGKDGAFEASPVEEWYNFQPINRYKCLSAEEAEKEFQKRDQIMNFFQVMKTKKDDNDPDEDEGKAKKKGKAKKSLLLSEMDDWLDDDDDDSNDGGDSDDSDRPKKKKKYQRKVGKGGKKKRRDDGASDDSCLEESDDYDEGAEHDYISGDSSDSDQEDDEKVVKDLAGVEEGDALKKLLESESEDENKEEKSDKSEDDEEDKESSSKEKSKKSKKRKRDKAQSDNSDSSSDEPNAKSSKNGNESTVSKLKRRVKENPMEMSSKKSKGDGSSSHNAQASNDVVSEESIRRYLMRKPMTTTELLQKFKKKRTGLESKQLVECIAGVLKRINPSKKMVKGKMYVSL